MEYLPNKLLYFEWHVTHTTEIVKEFNPAARHFRSKRSRDADDALDTGRQPAQKATRAHAAMLRREVATHKAHSKKKEKKFTNCFRKQLEARVVLEHYRHFRLDGNDRMGGPK
jgi:hypothetical protein